ncbi:MAG: helix-turn-helix transcriptional regulator [Solirubrobacteraceae bacterium]|nr:helix-turn-helix transcriptional regulator [Solirubrobacteraceae bacterium]
MSTLAQTAREGLQCFEALRSTVGTVSDPTDVAILLDAATREVTDSLLARDAAALVCMGEDLRAIIRSGAPTSDAVSKGRLTQLLSGVVAGLQRLPSPDEAQAVSANTHAHRMLRYIAHNREVAHSDLRSELGLGHDEASRSGRVLADRGLVTKAKAGRTVWWSITDRGTEVLGRLEPDPDPPHPLRRHTREEATNQLEHWIARDAHSLQTISRNATAILLDQGGASEISRRILLWKDVAQGPKKMSELEFRYTRPGAPVDQSRRLLWSTLKELSPGGELKTFISDRWPLPAPSYDAYIVVKDDSGPRGLVFLDARIAPGEFKEAPFVVRAEHKKKALSLVIDRARRELDTASATAWKRYPDPATRIAFLLSVHEHFAIPVWHLNLYFVAHRPSGPLGHLAPSSEDDWLPTIENVRRRFALDASWIGDRIRREFVFEPTSYEYAQETLSGVRVTATPVDNS